MKLKIDNSSISQLFSLVQQVQEVKQMICGQETILEQVLDEVAEARKEQQMIEIEVGNRAKNLKEGSMEALQELLHVQWRQQEAAKKVATCEMKRAGVEANLSLLDTELVGYQKEIDAVLQGHKA